MISHAYPITINKHFNNRYNPFWPLLLIAQRLARTSKSVVLRTNAEHLRTHQDTNPGKKHIILHNIFFNCYAQQKDGFKGYTVEFICTIFSSIAFPLDSISIEG